MFCFCFVLSQGCREKARLSPTLKQKNWQEERSKVLNLCTGPMGGGGQRLDTGIQWIWNNVFMQSNPQARPLSVGKGIWEPAWLKCYLWTDLRRETSVLNPVTMQSFISFSSSPSPLPPTIIVMHMSKNSTDGACFYERSPEIWFEISPVSSVLLSLQQMQLNVSNWFVACATTRAEEEGARTVREAEIPAQHNDPWAQLLHQPRESPVPVGTASEPQKNQFFLPSSSSLFHE